MSDEAEVREGRLSCIRQEINTVDRELLTLLNRRALLSLEVGRIKAEDTGIIFKPLREKEVLDALCAENTGPLPESHLRIVWREIFSSSRALQRPQQVAYLGPEGTFSYFAGVEYLGRSVSLLPCSDLEEVFRRVHDGQCELGVVPLENSLQGTVGTSFDLFLTHEVYIQAELFLRISHCLLSNANSLGEIRTVYSHPQPLAQCAAWLRSHLPGAALVPVESTAAAALRAAQEPGAAAVGHRRLAEMASLALMARAIEDEPGNWTRFVIIGPQSARSQVGAAQNMPVPGHTGAEKTSLLFTLPDKAGALCAILDLLARERINMRKLESRPMRGERWRYVFFVDVECDLETAQYTAFLEKLSSLCTSFRILGSYPTGPQLDRLDMGASAASENDAAGCAENAQTSAKGS